jgi:sarcosine oxidase
VIRETSFEHPRYVPLARQAYENWRRLEADTGETLLHITGALYIGSPDRPLVAGTLASAREHGIAHRVLAEDDLRREYPVFRRLEGVVGVLEPSAGWIDPERCVAACLRLAGGRSVELRFDEPLLGWEPDGDGVLVTTPRRRYRAGRLLLAAGPWMPELLGSGGVSLTVERQVQHWFSPALDAEPGLARLPVFIRQADEAVFYAIPGTRHRPAFKIAVHHDGAVTTPDTVLRTVAADEVAAARSLLERYAPALAGEHRRAAVCLYTNAADGHFVIDRHPAHHAVVVASPCSGFGFKFASAVGEILADLLLDRSPAFDLAPFRINRYRRSRT